jgi:hypothetical protein
MNGHYSTVELPMETFSVAVHAPRWYARELLEREIKRLKTATVIAGTLRVRQMREKGRFVGGWWLSCKAITNGQLYNLGEQYDPKPDDLRYQKLWIRCWDADA